MSASCARITTCPLFTAFSMKSSLKVWRTYYCEGGFTKCERLKRVQAGQSVPANLLPNGRLLDRPLDQLQPSDMT